MAVASSSSANATITTTGAWHATVVSSSTPDIGVSTFGVVNGRSLFVGVDNTGTEYLSRNALTWTPAGAAYSSTFPRGVHRMAYANGTWVAVTTNTIWFSRDAQTWSATTDNSTVPSNTPAVGIYSSLVGTPSGFFALTTTGYITTSTDGQNWKDFAIASGVGLYWQSITSDDQGASIVIAGRNNQCTSSCTPALLEYGLDASGVATPAALPLASQNKARWTKVLYLPTGTFLAVSDTGLVVTSGDGANWDPSASFTAAPSWIVVYNDKFYAQVGSSVFSSLDGLAWTKEATVPVSASVAVGGGRLAIRSATTLTFTGTDVVPGTTGSSIAVTALPLAMVSNNGSVYELTTDGTVNRFVSGGGAPVSLVTGISAAVNIAVSGNTMAVIGNDTVYPYSFTNGAWKAAAPVHGFTFLTDVAVSAGSIWTVDSDSGELYRITGGKVTPIAPVGTLPNTVCADSANVWVADSADNMVVRYDIVAARSSTIALIGSPTAISCDGKSVWVLTNTTDALVQLNATTGGVLHTIGTGASPVSVDSDGTTTWVSNSDSSVTAVDVATATVTGTYQFSDYAYSSGGLIAATPTTVYMGNYTDLSLGIINRSPTTPSKVTVTARDGGANYSFTNAGVATGYEYSVDGGLSWTNEFDDPSSFTSSTGTLTSLRNGTTYSLIFRSFGLSGTSAASAPILVTPRPAPVTPGALTATSVTYGPASITVSYHQPTTTGSGPLTTWSLSCTSATGGATVTSSTSSSSTTSLTVSKLSAGKAYACSLIDVNSGGYRTTAAVALPVSTGFAAGFGRQANGTFVPDIVPAAPASVTAVRGNQSVVVTWAAPAANGGSAVTGYSLNVTPTVAIPAACSHLTASSPKTCILTGLTNGTSYVVHVAATNAVGVGATASSTATTPAAAPGIPVINSVTAGSKQLTVTWTDGATNGSALSSRVVTYSAVGQPTMSVTVTSGNSLTITKLLAGLSYSVTVKDTNAVGSTTSTAVKGTPTA